jgi:ribonuclease-3
MTTTFYNPYNSNNRLFGRTEIQAILSKHKCEFKPTNTQTFQMAMVHSSYVKRKDYTTPNGETSQLAPKPADCLELFDESYERLEHLGDSILGACVSTYLMQRFPQENEGFLTDLKKEIVCNETLGRLSEIIGLAKFYVISRHNEDICAGRTNTKKLGDILEAFIGALWTDTDYDFKIVYAFIISLVELYIDIPKILMNNRNFKEQFQKLYQSMFHITPTYQMASCVNGQYTMEVIHESKVIGRGMASTKKQAEQLAAKESILYFQI